VQYPISAGALAAEVNAAAASCDSATIIAEATQLDAFNNAGCPLDQQGACTNAKLDEPSLTGDSWHNAFLVRVWTLLPPAVFYP